jgi:hypothetical protein
MHPRTYWQNYVDANGGPVGVADRLGIPYSTITNICNGWRGIGRNLAQRMVAADPSLDAATLVFVGPLKPAQNPTGQGEHAPRKRAA